MAEVTLTDRKITDLLNTTLDDFGPPTFEQVAQELQSYEIMGNIFKRKRRYVGGTQLSRVLMFDSKPARQTAPYDTRDRNVIDATARLTVPHRHTTTSWEWDRLESLENSKGQEIVDLLKIREAESMIGMAEHIEALGWSRPIDLDLDVYGIPTWIVKYSAADPTPGFQGGNPPEFPAGVGGIDSTQRPKWRNYAGKYTNFTEDDLLIPWQEAALLTNFKSPMSIKGARMADGGGCRYYVNTKTLLELKKLQRKQNDSIGTDLFPYDGEDSFKRCPIIHVPALDVDPHNPIYGINWGYFGAFFLRGNYMRRGDAKQGIEQPTVWVVDLDLSWNMACFDRRRQMVLSQGTDIA